jgi:hypothetical protein
MKKLKRKLLRLIQNQQVLTAQCLDIIKAGYAQEQHDTAEDQGRTEPHPVPDIHKPVKVIEPVTQLEQYQ